MVLLAKRVSASVVESISISVSSAWLSAITRPAMRWSSARVKRAPFSASAAVLSTDREDVFAPFERRARDGGDFFLVRFILGFGFTWRRQLPLLCFGSASATLRVRCPWFSWAGVCRSWAYTKASSNRENRWRRSYSRIPW